MASDQEENTLYAATFSSLAAVIVVLLVVLAVVGAVWAHLRRKNNKKGNLLLGDASMELVDKPSFSPIKGAFVIPFDQLQLGPIIAAGAQGQVRKGFFSGNAVAIKELIVSLFDPQQTADLKVLMLQLGSNYCCKPLCYVCRRKRQYCVASIIPTLCGFMAWPLTLRPSAAPRTSW